MVGLNNIYIVSINQSISTTYNDKSKPGGVSILDLFLAVNHVPCKHLFLYIYFLGRGPLLDKLALIILPAVIMLVAFIICYACCKKKSTNADARGSHGNNTTHDLL